MDEFERHENPQRNSTEPEVPQYVYWIRRTVALIIVIAVLLLAFFLIKSVASLFSRDDAKETTNSQAPAKSGTDKETSVSKNEPGDDTSPAACPAGQVELGIKSARTSIAQGATFPMTVTMKYSGEEPCVLDSSAEKTVVTISSGKDRIWSNKDCDDSGTRPLRMENGASSEITVNWDSVRSDATCSKDLPAVKAGTYKAVATYGDSASAELVFQVK